MKPKFVVPLFKKSQFKPLVSHRNEPCQCDFFSYWFPIVVVSEISAPSVSDLKYLTSISPAEGNGKSSARWWGTYGFLWVGAYRKDVLYFQQWIHDNSVWITPSWKDYALQDVRCGFHFLFPSLLTPFFSVPFRSSFMVFLL